ncbi:hypothetical protein FHS61_002500 [Altererythrobacter atlanticus]|uniref:RcnB family protein n=1 Tax=Croceibacterium atlanticum TaxID=1267766 RepID=UPI001799DD9C|nr:RcnB family protein [Croceibacterium atlanticum]MBB5733465.1 hypothetical protein [Croceibacterium atlanticum]
MKNSGFVALAVALSMPAIAGEAAAAADNQWRNKGERALQHQRNNESARSNRDRAPRMSDNRGGNENGRVERRNDRNADRGNREPDRRETRSRDRTSDNRRDYDRDRTTWRDNDRNRSYRDNDRNRSYTDRDRNRSYRDNDRRWNDNRRQTVRRDHRDWDRRWRNNNRYDWQRYRRANRSVFSLGFYYSPYRNYSYRRLGTGFRLDSLFYSSRYWINDPWRYRLPAVYGPYRWVRYYDDVLLVDIYDGRVVDVIYDFFW